MKILSVPPVVVLALCLAACGGGAGGPPASAPGAAQPARAAIEVPIVPKSGSQLTGKATFTAVEGGVKVTVQVSGASPGEIATHVHETGDCSAPDAKSAGGHFNPLSKPHGLPPGEERHLGDLGNITIKADGTGSTEIVVKGASLADGDPNSYVGKAIIVHAKKDDGGQPVGNAGDRIGCGVIR